MQVGATATLTVTVAPDDAANKAGTWSSSDESLATVDQTGKVTAVAVTDTTKPVIKFTTTDGAITASCEVTITAAA